MWADLFGCDSNVSMPSAEFNQPPPLARLSMGNSKSNLTLERKTQELAEADTNFSEFMDQDEPTETQECENFDLGLNLNMCARSDDMEMGEMVQSYYDPILAASFHHNQKGFIFGNEYLQPMNHISESYYDQENMWNPYNHIQQRKGYHRNQPMSKPTKKRKIGKKKKGKTQPPPPRLSLEDRIKRRVKQINMGKNTPEYQLYTKLVPKQMRSLGQPQTPDVHKTSSKRTFDKEIRAWRRSLHAWNDERKAAFI